MAVFDDFKQKANAIRQSVKPPATSKGNWYKGAQPTQRETLARIYELGAQNETKRVDLMRMYEDEVLNPSSPIYNPYTSSTTSKLNKTNLTNTQKAQDEWARLSDELSYWATRTDRNYSDDEIISRINWDNYKTLQKMDEGRMTGSPLELLEGVGYSEDAMYGVLWAARNPSQSTGNAMYDAAQRELGRGVQYQRNEQTAERLNPMSQQYNPYVVGSTMDDLAYMYHTDRFDDQWLAENRDLLLDPETAKDYGRIYDAVQNTSAIQAEAEALKQELARYAETGVQPDFDYLLGQSEYKNLAELRESLRSGQIMDTADVIDFDLPSLISEAEDAYALKQAQLNAAKDLEAAKRLAEKEKKGSVEWFGGLFARDTTPEETVPQAKPIVEETPQEILASGVAIVETGAQGKQLTEAVSLGDYEFATAVTQQRLAELLEQNPELMTTDGTQKAALLALVLANEAGWLTDPAAQEKAKSIQDTVTASMSIETETEEAKGFLAWLDDKLQTGGALVAAQENGGLGFQATAMLLWDRTMARGADFVDNIVGGAIAGVGELVGSEKLVEFGKEIMSNFDKTVEHYDTVLAEKGTPLEILAAQQGSEIVHMLQMGSLSSAVAKYNLIKYGEGAKLASRMLMASPFAAESAGQTLQETYEDTDDYTTALASSVAAYGVTSALSQWDGILKNIELNGMPYITEVVEKLAAVPGSGFKAGLARYGKAFGMWMMNGLKTIVNESMQEAAEGGLTDVLIGLIKGENLGDKNYWKQFGKDRLTEAVGSVFLSFGSNLSTLPAYATSVKVAESQMHKSNVTVEELGTFVTAMQEDMQDPSISEDALARAEAIAVETRTGELVAQGALGEIDTSAVDNAAAKLAEAEPAEQAANEAVARADEKFKANMADEKAANELMSAIDAQASAQKAADDARAELAAAQAEQEAAVTAQMNVVREQARVEVTQNMATVQEARLQQEAAAEVQRRNDNVLAMQANDFVEKFFGYASDYVKDQVRERYMSSGGETQNVARGAVELASQFSKKFNLNITFTDSHGVFEGAYKGGNDIVLDKNATQGEVIKRVLVHEITHAAESSEAYGALADAVLAAFYGENAEQMQADLDTIAKQYSEQAGQDGQSVARSELVAQRLSEMLSSNQEAMNRLVAEKPDVATRIWRAIKDFIGKLRGVRDPELDKLMKLEKQLEKALGSRTSSTSGTQFMIERGAGGVDVVVVEEDILDGVTVRDWPKVVRSVMVSRFPDGVPVGNNVIRINRDTRKEVTNSKDTMWLKHNDFSAYQDKLRATANSDEIIKASRDYVNEAPAHERKDRIVDFARGEVSMRIGGKEYDAEVVVGYDLDGSMRLYDFVRMTRTDEKKAGQPFEDESSRDSRAGLSELSVSENGSLVKPVSDGAEIIRGGATKFSLTSWTEKEKTEVRKSLIQNGYGPANVDQWIDNVNSVAAIIAGDKARLDYTADPDQVMLKNNQEYVKTLDASTLCAKRLLYQGTFNEIQHQLPNTVITSDMLLDLLNMMKDAGYESPCGVCYVESRRRHLGKFAEQWLNGRPKTKEQKAWEPYSGDYIPTLDELTTTDGLAKLKAEHPQTYNDFMKKMASLGSSNPKIVELRTDYRGDIRKITKSQRDKIEKIGGLRVQSFSDFETPHMIDMMQAVLDMAGKQLTSQAYTKVPNFAWVFGDTGIKINLSLLAEGTGLDENGNLIFSSSEGMDFEEAMRLRDRYSKNVGTIIVGANDAHIRAAMADPRIDYIIPFHRSGWGQNELKKVGVLQTYTDYQANQNERMLDGGKPEGGNFYPIDYWDYSKTGDENAAIYLRMCEEDGRIPKFEQFLEKDADGHWVAPSGYWKMLIDFKMYDNDGNGTPQQTVQPNFNMEEAVRVLDEYEGGADSLPVAYDIADRFVSEYKAANPGAKFSLPSNDILDQRIAQHRNSQLAPAPNDIIPGGGEPAQNYGDGERQFAGQTMQNSPVVPDWIKQEFLRPEELNYETDTNREQVERSWQRIQENGYEAERDRLLSLDRYNADDTAEANLMMAMALREDTADPATFMALASHYNKEGTKAGQELQARKLFTRMSPTGARVWAAGQMESNLEEHMRTHQPQRRRVDENARQVADQIRGLQGGDELLRLNAGGDFTIDESNNRWGIPINEQQQALIDHYGLNNVGRPGIFYNRATTKQRMLEAILATPNPLEVTGLGLNLIQRLEFMQDGETVITNADLNYIGTQLGQFVAQGGDDGGREADLAVSRAYEAYGNITPATRMEKFRTQRYVNMLSTFTSFARNIIGNVGQNVANAAAHGIGVEIDRLASLRTGRRTMAHLSAAERIEGWKAFAEETKNTFLDFFVDKANTAPNRDKYSTNQHGRVFQSGALEMSKDIESFLMSVGDRNIWKKAFVNSMAEQQKLSDRNQLFNDDGTTRSHEQMVEHAEAAANYATFTEDSLAQDVMQFIRQSNPATADVLSLYLPFTGVPHNIMKRNFQYSPLGFLTMAGRMAANRINGRNFDQNAFVNDLSRALTGTGGVLMGVVLGLVGAIKMGTEDEQKDKVYDVETALGEQYTPYVYDPTTDTYVSMSTFAPAASPLVWGAAIGQQLKNDEFNANVLLSALSSSVDSIFDASYLSGLSDLFGGYGSFTENLAHVTAENLASQLTPAFLNQVANAMDPYVRDTKDKDYLTELMKTTLNRIPILRNKLLPEKVTVAGENVPTKQGWSLVDPFTRTNPSDNAALIEVKRLYDAVGDTAVLPSDALRSRKNSLTLNKKSVTLNDQQKAEYKKYYGDLWTGEVSALMATTAYQLMDDEERAEKVEKIMADALKRAKKEFIDRYGE